MRKIATCITVLGVALLAIPGVASATPTVKFKSVAVPISGYKGTGNIAGAGAALQTEYEISGTEYGGSPPPIIGVNFYFPQGTVLHPSGFKTCTKVTLEQFGPAKCPKGSAAGPIGVVHGFVTLGGERVEEEAELSSFYAPGGGIEFFTDGHSPVSLEILSSGHYTGASGLFSHELITEVPLVASVPGAPYASVKSITIKAGSATGTGKNAIFYGRVPKTCPKRYLPVKTEVIFAQNGEMGNPVTVPAEYHAPCPRGAKR